VLRAVNTGMGNFDRPSPLRLRSHDHREVDPPPPAPTFAGSPPRARVAATPELAIAPEEALGEEEVEAEAEEAAPLSARVTGRQRKTVDRLGATGAVPKPKAAAKAKAIAKPKGAPHATGPRGSYIENALKKAGYSSGKSTESPMVINGRHLGSPPPKLKDLQKQLNEANQKVAALEYKQITSDELTAYKVRMAVAEAEAKFHTVSSVAFQSGCDFAMKLAAQSRA